MNVASILTGSASETASLDALRARLADLHSKLADAKAARTKAHAATADSVATNGAPPAGWGAQSAELDNNIHALELGIERMEKDVHAEVGGVRLGVAKLGQIRLRHERELDRLYSDRIELFASASKSATVRLPLPANLVESVTDLERKIAATTSELEATKAEISAAESPLVRYDSDSRATHQRADSAAARAN